MSNLETIYDSTAEVHEPAKPTGRFTILPFNEITLSTARNYLVKGLIPREGLVVVWGPPKCGKSFWTFDLTMHIALGLEYRGRRVVQGPVVYVACEGASGLRARVEAFRQSKSHRESLIPFYLIPETLTLPSDLQDLIGSIRITLGDVVPSAVVLDTLNRSIEGSENQPEDMGSYVKAADAIRAAFNCAVFIVHHCGVEGSRPRGHTSLTGAADAQLAVNKTAAGVVSVRLECMKDGPEGDEIFSRLQQVEVGQDEDGEAMTSCVVIPEDAPAKSVKLVNLTAKQQQGLDVLHNCLADAGKPAPGTKGYPSGARVVSLGLWRESLFKAGVLDEGAANPRTAFSRLKEQLKNRDAIGEWDGLIWAVNVAGLGV